MEAERSNEHRNRQSYKHIRLNELCTYNSKSASGKLRSIKKTDFLVTRSSFKSVCLFDIQGEAMAYRLS